MKQRSPLTATLLSLFVPFYVLYWFYVTAQDLNRRGAKTPAFELLYVPVLGFSIVMLVAAILRGDGFEGAAAVVFLLLILVSFVAIVVCPLVYYYKFSEAVEQVTNRELTKGLLFVLFWFVGPAGVYLTQDKLNILANAGANTAQPAPPSQAPTPPVNPIPPANPVG